MSELQALTERVVERLTETFKFEVAKRKFDGSVSGLGFDQRAWALSVFRGFGDSINTRRVLAQSLLGAGLDRRPLIQAYQQALEEGKR